MLEIRNLAKSFSHEGSTFPVVRIPAFSLGAGAQVALRGKSGSGKTTFLHLVAGLHRADEGSVCIDGVDMAGLSEPARDRLRARALGYIFQTFNLLQGYTAVENLLLAMILAGRKADRTQASELLKRVGLGDRLDYLPARLSTGQQQRVALARALVNHPKLVLADEPTGNLDPEHSRGAIDLIREVCRENGAALLLVSHDEAVLSRFDTVLSFSELNLVAKGGVA